MPEDLAAAVRTAAAGRTTLAPTVADRLMNRLRTPGTALTRRETEVLVLVADGLSNQAVGDRLHLTEGTVKAHLARVYAKCGTVISPPRRSCTVARTGRQTLGGPLQG